MNNIRLQGGEQQVWTKSNNSSNNNNSNGKSEQNLSSCYTSVVELSDDNDYATPPQKTSSQQTNIQRSTKPNEATIQTNHTNPLLMTRPRIISRNMDRPHHKGVVSVAAPPPATAQTAGLGAYQDIVCYKTSSQQKLVLSSVKATLSTSSATMKILPTTVSSQTSSSSRESIATPPSKIVIASQQSIVSGSTETRKAIGSLSSPKSTNECFINAKSGGVGNNAAQAVSTNMVDKRLHQGGSHYDGGVANAGNATTTSRVNAYFTPTTSASAASTTAAATAVRSPSAQEKNRDNSRVIEAKYTATSSPSRTRDQEMSSTPPLPAPPSPSQHPGGKSINGAQLSREISTTSHILPKTLNALINTNANTKQLKTLNYVGGIRMKSRPKRKGPIMSPPPTPPSTINDNRISETKIDNPAKNAPEIDDATKISSNPTQTDHDDNLQKIFSWDLYLKLVPADYAPKEAFNQPNKYPKNNFQLHMKLEVRDPRNSSVWGLATIVGIEGLYLRLRFDNTDKSNDVFELIDSDRIRSIGSTGEQLLPPVNFKGNIANYGKFVEKVLTEPTTVIAPPEIFPPAPKEPMKNIFKVGMKLEAVDAKNRDLVCPATIGQVNGNTIRIVFDGWRGSFDYDCDYRSRDIFPINWCRDTGHFIQPPNGWEGLVKSGGSPALQTKFTIHKSQQSDPKTQPKHKHHQKHVHPQLANSREKRSNAPQTHKGEFIPEQRSSQGFNKSKHSKLPRNSKLVIYPTSLQVPRATYSNLAPKKTAASNSVDNINKVIKKRDSVQKSGSPDLTSPSSSSDISSDGNMLSVSPSSDMVLSNNEFGKDVERYQCQRAISYDDWKRKKERQQMPQGEGEHPLIQENGDDNVEEPILSFTNSTSSSSVQATTSDKDNLDAAHLNKKFKIGTPGQADDEDCVGKVLRSKAKSSIDWSVEDVIDLISTDEALAKYSTVFKENEIDGKAFILLTKEILLKHMGLKLGPYLKIADLIDRVKKLK